MNDLFDDVMAIQNRLARTVARIVQANLTAQDQDQLARVLEIRPATFESYLRARLSKKLSSSTPRCLVSLGLFSYFTATRSLLEDPRIRAEARLYPVPMVPFPKNQSSQSGWNCTSKANCAGFCARPI